MSQELRQYIESALASGQSKDAVEKQLTDSGWSPQLVQKALYQYSGLDEQGLLIPTPKARFHHIIRDIFVYLLTIVTLSLSIYALGDLLIRLVEKLIPDMALGNTYRNSAKSTHWFISQLIVALPFYLYLARWTAKDVFSHPEKRDTLVRKLMIYTILYITASVAIGDFIYLLFSFLNGDLTIHFVLKASVILVLSLGVFGYYFVEIRHDDEELSSSNKSKKALFPKFLGVSFIALSLMAIIGGLFVTGGPAYQRLVNLDEKRLTNLSHVADSIEQYHRKQKQIPIDLNALQQYMTTDMEQSRYLRALQDPETGNFYTYDVKADKAFELCATFATDSTKLSDGERFRPYTKYGYVHSGAFSQGEHPKGHHCYTFKIKKSS
jgi:hypothetical protein